MIDSALFALTFCSALGCGLMAGVFFAFSAFIMTALARIPPTQGIAAMQSINVAVINPLFGVAFFGTAAACALLAVSSLLTWRKPGVVHLLVGSLLLPSSVGLRGTRRRSARHGALTGPFVMRRRGIVTRASSCPQQFGNA